jgi:hypothetical protein
MQSLDEYWSPTDLMEQPKTVSLQDIPHCASEHIQWPSPYPAQPLLSVHASPFQEGLYTIWVHFHSVGPELSDMPVLTVHKYRLSLSSGICASDLLCVRSFSIPIGRGCTNIARISYSGHTQIYDCVARVQRVLALPELHGTTTSADDIIELPESEPDSPNPVHISAYSGALTYSGYKTTLVNYYL